MTDTTSTLLAAASAACCGLLEISEADAEAEGCPWDCTGDFARSPQEVFADLWNNIHGPDAWDANPWVCALTFTVERRNIDEARP
jgi:hypothetical protein